MSITHEYSGTPVTRLRDEASRRELTARDICAASRTT